MSSRPYNIVFIAKSLDGYIADKNGGLDWLHTIPNPDNLDMGYNNLMERIDGILMGRNTFDTVCGFDILWPYTKPVFVLSNSIKEIPEKFQEHATLVSGDLKTVLTELQNQGIKTLYIDGGKTVQSFLKENLVDELIISTIPIILGGGIRLFGVLEKPIHLKHIKSEVFLNAIVQDSYLMERQ